MKHAKLLKVIPNLYNFQLFPCFLGFKKEKGQVKQPLDVRTKKVTLKRSTTRQEAAHLRRIAFGKSKVSCPIRLHKQLASQSTQHCLFCLVKSPFQKAIQLNMKPSEIRRSRRITTRRRRRQGGGGRGRKRRKG